MRTTLDLPLELLQAVEEATQAETRREAVIVALEDYVRRQRRLRVIAAAGSLNLDVDVRALRAAGNRRSDG